MLKVIIIDDEKAIREGLKTLIDWNTFDFQVCDTAAHGEEGLKKISEGHFDLAIVDIKMPILDGITMIKHLKELDCSCQFILLTAYSDFKSAQQAIDLGVYAYLLKPISKKELIEKLAIVKDAIINKKQTHEKLISYTSYEKNVFINDFMNLTHTLNVSQINTTYGFDFPWSNYAIAIIHFHSKNRFMMFSPHTLYNTIKDFIENNPHIFTFYTAQVCGILFEPSSEIPPRLQQLQDYLSKKFNTSLLICVGKIVYDLSEITLSFQSASSLIENSFLYEYKGVLYVDELCESSSLISDEIELSSFSQLLFEASELGHAMIINNLLEKLKNHFKSHQEYTENLIKLSYVTIYTTFLHLTLLHLNNYPDIILKREQIIGEIESKNSLQELHGYFKYLFISFSSELASHFSVNDIHSILTYINQHYSENLKLDKLAQTFGYNSTYLGKLIKKNTGYNFNTYLDILRIEHAKKLLLEGMKVFEVCEKVGFCDTDYFTKKFKKYIGTTPSQYKNNF